jgi:hypothetical protein
MHRINLSIDWESKSRLFLGEIRPTMKRARSLDEDNALAVPQKLVYNASTFVVGLVCFWSERVVFFIFLPLLLEHDLVTLLTKHGMEEQAEKLMRGELKELYLSGCWIGDDGAVTVAAFIKVDDTLEKVWLWSNNIGPRGAEALADALKCNKKVWYLSLNGNHIGDDGAEALLDALSHNVCLTVLYVYNNNIAPESEATIKYLTETRNAILIPAAVRRASLYLIAARRATPIADAGILSIFPKEIVRLIAMAVWATRKDPKWIEVVK